MSDHDGSLAFHQSIQRFEDQLFRSRVQAGAGLVQDQDRRIADDGAGDGDPLPLAAGKRDAAFAENGVVAIGELFDKLMRVG